VQAEDVSELRALWAYDWRIVLLENLIAYGGKAVMYTLTPPGTDVLPFDRARCSHSLRRFPALVLGAAWSKSERA
jgi:hypothetical protein